MLKTLCKETRTINTDWIEVKGIPCGLGNEKWFKHKLTGHIYYCCNYEGSILIELCDKTLSINIENIINKTSKNKVYNFS